jgi:hypothetical protein
MCFPKAPNIPAPQALPERQMAKAPTDSAIAQNTVERTKRRLGFNLQYTPSALGPAVTTGKTLLGQ